MATKQKKLGPPKAPELYDVEVWKTTILPNGKKHNYKSDTVAYGKPFPLAKSIGESSIANRPFLSFYKLPVHKKTATK